MKSNLRKNASRKKRKKPLPVKAQPDVAQNPIMKQLSSIDLAKIMSGFMTFRSTVQDLSRTLQRLENMMNSTYQMFRIASHIIPLARRRGFPLLPFLKSNIKSEENEEIPVISLPFEEHHTGDSHDYPGGPPGPPVPNIDFNQIMSIVQSPVFQKLISNLFQSGKATTTSYSKRKQG